MPSGGEGGSDLTRSKLVAEDNRGDKIGAVVRAGRPDEGMPAFTVSDADLIAMVAFIHDQKTKSEALGGGRRSVEEMDLATGNAEAGRRYFNGAGGCAGCHSATGDLAGCRDKISGIGAAAAHALSEWAACSEATEGNGVARVWPDCCCAAGERR